MKITYDKVANMAYIYVDDTKSRRPDWGDSFEIKGVMEFSTLYIEFDKNGILIGIEVFGACNVLPQRILKLSVPSRSSQGQIDDSIQFKLNNRENKVYIDFRSLGERKEVKTKRYRVPDVFEKGGMNIYLDEKGILWSMEILEASKILPKDFLNLL